MSRDKDRITVECDAIYLNNVKPENWDKEQTFKWKPSISFHYYEVNDDFVRVGDLQRVYIKGEEKLWLHQAMGGQNAKGHFFDLMTETGTYQGKVWVAVTPVAELFRNGNSRMIKAPIDGKVNVPAKTDNANNNTQQAQSIAKTAPVTPATPPKPAAPVPPKESKPRPKPGEKFIQLCFEPQTNQFFRMQDGFAQDGYVISQSGHMALEAAKSQIAWRNQWNSDKENFTPATDAELKEEFIKWTDFFECVISQRQWTKTRERIHHIIKNCLNVEQVTSAVEMAWAKLPQSHYDWLRDRARERVEEFNDAKETGSPVTQHANTATPEVCEGQDPIEQEIVAGIEEEIRGPVEPTVPPAEDPIIDFTAKAILDTKGFVQLLNLWETTVPAYQSAQKVKDAMWLWIEAKFVEAKYQADVVGMIEQFPKGILEEPGLLVLKNRYAQLLTF